MLTDSLGNALTLHDPASLDAVNDFVEGFIACEARAVNILQIAHTDASAVVQALCAALHMFAESAQGPVNARPYLERALTALHAGSVTPRERGLVLAIAAWVDGDMALAHRLHEQQTKDFPRDLVALKLGQYHLFNQGDAPAMLRLALHALPAASDVPYVHGMAAFAWEQCHFLEQAEVAAHRAIDMCRKEPWAHHALAHVMLTTGRITEGQQFMASVSDTWTGLNSFMVTHNFWHQALFALELGQHTEALRLYDEQVWGVVKDYSQDQIGAVSLLSRLELAGVDVGNRWQDVAGYLCTRVDDHVLPFLDLHYLYGLARAGRAQAQTLVQHIETFAHANREKNAVWLQVAAPAGRGLLAHAQGDFENAREALGLALPRLLEIGGSHAQRDWFEQIYLDALMRTGRWNAAQHVLQQQVRLQPESTRLHHLASKTYGALGLQSLITSAIAPRQSSAGVKP